ncbi:MAG TPA: hypothetical protein VFH68_22630 [Polyangia bacterium]|nr:hypothetical protein [Polyangia bacterium]
MRIRRGRSAWGGWRQLRGGLVALLLALALARASGCAGVGANSSAAPAPGTDAGGSGVGLGLGGVGGERTGAGGAVSEPEREIDGAYQAPVATGRFVWIANPSSGHVAYVDAATLAVKTVEAGDAPTTIAAVPDAAGGDQVIVLNQLSHDATVLRADGAGGPPASRTITGVVPGANRVAVSPLGRFVIAWIDGRGQANARPTDGFQSITVIDLGAPAAAADAGGGALASHVTVAVGFRPVSITFAADEQRAFAVTEDGVSIIALDGASGPRVTGNVALGDDATASVDTRDVSITADGRWAVVRREGSDTVSLVELGTGAITALRLSGPVTDLDLTADGTRALAVVRATGEVALIPLDAPAPVSGAITHLTIAGETIGQAVLTADGATAVLYSNAVAAQRLTVLSLGATPTWRTLRVHAPVLAVVPSPDGRGAVVLHPADASGAGGAAGDAGLAPDGGRDGGAAPGDGAAPGATPEVGAFSLLSLDGTQPAFIQATDAPLRALAFSPAGDRVLLTVRDDRAAVFAVYLALFPTLEVRRYPLASPPIAAGVAAAARRGYVAQQHPEGRITFFTLDSGEARTLTGYELGARVVDWSRP